MINKKIQVYGHVQGVGFRFAAQRAAKSYGIKGFVKNMPDGSVYIEAEADEEKLNYFINWCKLGPSYGKVTNINVEQGELKNYKYFDIRF